MILRRGFNKTVSEEDELSRLSKTPLQSPPQGFPCDMNLQLMDELICQQFDLICCHVTAHTSNTPPRTSDPKGPCRVTRAHTVSSAAMWGACMSSVKHLEMCSSLLFFIGLFSWGRSCQMFTLRHWDSDYRLSHFTRFGVFGSIATSAAASPAPSSALLFLPFSPLQLGKRFFSLVLLLLAGQDF